MNTISMEDIIARLKARRNALELSFQDLATLTGMSKSTLQRYESGAIKNIPLSRVEDLATALQTTPEYLMGWDDDPYDYDKDIDNRINSIPDGMLEGLRNTYGDNWPAIWKAYQEIEKEAQQESHKFYPRNIIPMPHTHKIPVVGKIACGTPILAQQNIEDYKDCPDFVHADFALRCEGDSMINARIFDGDLVFVRRQQEVENGEIAAVQIDDDGDYDATLKRYYRSPDKITLRAENPTFADIVLAGEDMNRVHIAGKAVYFVGRVR